jgi:uncharacterized protein YcsI (UPF0317 family)
LKEYGDFGISAEYMQLLFLFHSQEVAQVFIQFTIANDSPCPENYSTLSLFTLRSHKI